MISSNNIHIPKEPSWKLYSWGIVALFIFFQLMNWPLSPKFLDMYYHLSVMKGFGDAGGYVTNAFWEYAPTGRPHLYPPVLHFVMLFFYKIGLSAISVGRLADFLSFPLLLLVFWRLVALVRGERSAFFALIVLSSVYSIGVASVTLPAFNLSFIFFLMAARFLYLNRFVSPGILLGVCFYTHTLAGWLLAIYMTLCLFFNPKNKMRCGLSLVIGLLLALPFLIYQVNYQEFYQLIRTRENSKLEVDILVWALAAIQIVLMIRKKTFSGLQVPVGLWLACLPLLYTHPIRFLYGHGLLGAVWLAAQTTESILFSSLIPAKSRRLAVAAVLLFIALVSPVFRWDFEKNEKGAQWMDRSLTRYLFPQQERSFLTNGFSIYFEKPYKEMVDVIVQNSSPGDIIWTDFSYTAGILGVLSNRATSCGMLAEVKPFSESNRIQDSKIIIWFKEKDLSMARGMAEARQKYGLELLKETDMAYLFKNPGPTMKSVVPKPIVSQWAAFFLLSTGLILPHFLKR